MKKLIYFLLLVMAGLLGFSACSDDETYAEQKEKERKAISSFLKRDVCIFDSEGDTVCYVGKIKVISEEQFLAQDSTTNLDENEYVLFGNSGVYMQVVRKGVGEKLESGKTKQILCRFFEFNILGDSLQMRDNVSYWAPDPTIMNVTNSSGTFSATFDTEIYGGGAMYLSYQSTSVPSGWLIPFTYIHIGRQTTEDGGIAKVRLIVPHSEGHSDASSNVYPCFYEITFQKFRD